MPEITARGVRFHVQQLASRHRTSQLEHPVVFIHGLCIDNLSSFYNTLANPMVQAGATVILYDMRGHGLSERPRTGYRLNDSVADLVAVLDTLGVDGPVHLVGNSYGGTVALGFAVACPERVASMVLIEAQVPIPGWPEQMATSIRNTGLDVAERLGMAQKRKCTRLAALVRDLITSTTLVADIGTTEPLADDAVRMLTCPVRAIYGEHSDVLHHAHILDGLLLQYTLTVLPDVDHSVLPKAARVVRAIILEWFATQALADAR
jgi:pimeloyl-ACP methyl ester carboxylesterase